MRDTITKDFGWKLLSLVLAGIIWYTIWDTTEHGGNKASTLPFGSRDWQTRTFTNVPVRVRSAPGDVRAFSIDTTSVDVTVNGRPEEISSLQDDDIRVIVDVTDIGTVPGRLRARVDVLTPRGVALINASPADVGVTVSAREVPQP